MALPQVSPGLAPADNYARINAGLSQVDNLTADLQRTHQQYDAAIGGEQAARVKADQQIHDEYDAAIGGEQKARADADQAIRDQYDAAIGGEQKARSDADQAIRDQYDAAIGGEQKARTDANAALGGRIDGVADDLAAEVDRAEDEGARLGSRIDGEIRDRTAAVAAVRSDVDGRLQETDAASAVFQEATEAGISANADSIAAEAKARVDAVAGLDTRLDAQADAAAQADVSRRLLMLVASRPGDDPAGFTSDLAAFGSVLPPAYAVATTSRGRVMRISGAGILTPLALRAVQPGRMTKASAVLARYADTRDPSGDAVGLFLAWYGVDRSLLGMPTAVSISSLTVRGGALVLGALVSPDLGGANVIRPPAGAVYLRPYVETWGDTPITDVLDLATADVTDVGGVSIDLDADRGRISALEMAVAALPGAMRRQSFVRSLIYGA